MLDKFKAVMSTLDLTHELPINGQNRFLDTHLRFKDVGVRWSYDPRANKPLLHFNSAHSKLVKRAIAMTCLRNAVMKCCPHCTSDALNHQANRLQSAGYPQNLIVSVAESLLKKMRSKPQTRQDRIQRRQKIAVIPYMHTLSHNLKKVAQRYDVKVVFSAPHKLSKLFRMTDPEAVQHRHCGTEHRRPFVECAEGVVYEIPLSCGKVYVGQTGRCVNDKLREHANNVKKAREGKDFEGFLANHCLSCNYYAPEL